jgi:Reverse transcriptase (RNA-dependent DNA polymerase)
MIKFRGRDEILVRNAYSVVDQDEGYRLYMDSADYDEDYLDEEEDDEDVYLDAMADIVSDAQLNDIIAEQHEMELGGESNAAPEVPAPRRSQRETTSTRMADFIYAAIKVECNNLEELPWDHVERIHGLVEDATIRGEQGQKAAAKLEIEKLLHKYKAIVPVKLDKNHKKEVIKGKLFVKEKDNAEGVFTRNKGRIVARGDMRKNKPDSIQEVFSPTVAFPTFLTLLNIILSRRYSYMIVDVESAYLNSKYDEEVYMRLEPYVAELLLELEPSARKFVNEDGSMYVKIVKAIYGLHESAKLWYEHLGRTLISIGFKRSNYDHALYIRRSKDGSIVLIYVDDMIIAGTEKEILDVKSELEKVYTINSSNMSPSEFDYIGIKVEYDAEDHAFLLSQPKMVEKVTAGITDSVDLPCDMRLYQETDTEKLEDKTKFRSELMEIAYLSRTRPDLKVAIGYLSTKMQDPTKEDDLKLQRMKKYINGSKDLKLRIKPTSAIQVYASADASFGPFKDGKSNSGMAIMVGYPNAPILAKTSKQKAVANSSTSAELIAFSSTLEEVLWVTELLNELGFEQEPVEIEQDNSSTMRLIEKGPSSAGRTKWINIKHYWVSEHLTSGKIKLKYVPSLDMLADGLTKPLGKKAFLQWRARILNSKQRVVS